jgi:hypothetical protein
VETPATVVWIAPDPPDAGPRRALASWAAARDLRLVEPVDLGPTPIAADPGDPRVPEEVEEHLDRARDALAALDGAGVDAELAAADALLRAHAELPEAAWLMAEVERARAVRWRRVSPLDAEAADRAGKRAEALDGGRAAGIGEEAAASGPAGASLALPGALGLQEQRWLDGRPVGERAETHAGLHALVVTWAGAPVWAAWREAPPGPSTIELGAPGAAACSRADVAPARIEGDRVLAGPVRCGRWVAATPGADGSAREARVALCEAGRCGALQVWRLPEPWTEPAADRPAERRWPAWATWSAVGAGAAIAAGAAVVIASALRTPPAETRFVTGGRVVE